MSARTVHTQRAIEAITSGQRVFVHGGAATPQALIKALVSRAPELKNVEIVQIHTEGPAPYAQPELSASFRPNVFFIGANMREAVQTGRADYIPVFLSEVPRLFRRGILPLDVAMVHVSPPDQHGFMSLGVSVDIARAAVDCARVVIAQVNPNMPRTHGDSMVHKDHVDMIVECNDAIPETAIPPFTSVEDSIGRHVASLVEDGACLQMGIGAIPNAVLSKLGSHKHLGVHSEMFSDGLVDLVESGVVTGEMKTKHPGKIVSGFVMGTKRVFDFVNDNPLVEMLDIAYINDAAVIRRNARVTAINSAIEVDLTGQICADSIGHRLFSGVGGQMDFMHGASLSEGGKPIIALPSTTSKGVSRIVNTLRPGAGVVTTRAHVHYVVTEHGIADLYGKNLRQRARALIEIAHPEHREFLEEQARSVGA
ncbi:MAG: 4-hydroxybutyrate CoA-transferase [Spirochaetia bacterium]|nr:4-hydroxybutyrate CoA-transferase [Spirochaetia bacterium]